jgi:hypothetical protein
MEIRKLIDKLPNSNFSFSDRNEITENQLMVDQISLKEKCETLRDGASSQE